MKTAEANIEIVKVGNESTISIIMPTWQKIEEDNDFITVNIPLFGLKTISNSQEDTITAIHEALKCFLISSNRFGQGVEKELQALGWVIIEKDENKTLLSYSIESSDFVLEQIMETGDQFVDTDLTIA
ncbi:MAG: hypothetical protein Q8K64_09065 [Sediminibacterium sp.]|nr:MAG: hypothetical protein FD183_1163 [Chitinophagaceae bacterium]MDP1843555.1 hypothetical protein [Sediminibacterium sp.]